MRGRGFSFHGPVNSGEAGGHRSKPEVVLALLATQWSIHVIINEMQKVSAEKL